ncbi:CRISPR-associated helicase Cas3' [Alkaliphilus sp. B6464]|uniref:CRISPR-associated helicase Cas3' n=1 Tax=Alkaliphilus sp. B6464 TaxID=2731219 RepID=UPI001BA6A355|nr:CRISPR-associated helicase Cas3' [Alkaliphilus sp. B6464]QUH21805.1 CRISPR-associated helicase Cas3' [Alkaliphilus sp. B6464]
MRKNMLGLISTNKPLYAHVYANREETILEHSELALKVLNCIIKEKRLDKVFNRVVGSINQKLLRVKMGELSSDTIELIKKMLINTIYLHDIGKINPAFQDIKMQNYIQKYNSSTRTNHSPLSMSIFIDIFYVEVENIKEEVANTDYLLLKNILMICGTIISSHHLNLESVSDFFSNKKYANKLADINAADYLKYYYKDKLEEVSLVYNETIVEKLNIKYELYILSKLLFSLLIASDFYATYAFYNEVDISELNLGLINDSQEFFKKYSESPIYKSIQKFKIDPDSVDLPINKLRNEIFQESEDNLLKNLHESLFNLESPTGSGKTNISINLAKILIENTEANKLFYVFPFNTLIEQTNNTLQDIFKNKKEFVMINSVSPTIERHNDNGIDYSKSLLDRQMFNYPVVSTSHVNLFNTLFGVSRVSNIALFQLIDSVIVLDEIQSYRNSIWQEIFEFLTHYAKLFNIKIIIMSATLPNFEDLLVKEPLGMVNLISSTSVYYKSPLFRDRVTLDFELLNKNITLNNLHSIVEEKMNELSKSRIRKGGSPYVKSIVAFIKKKTARKFYNLLKKKYEKSDNYLILELTGDDNTLTRQQTLNKIKSENINNNIILISTQVIEAGVDIDMDIGFKDISILDSDEQFNGRVNRSCRRSDAVIYYFDLDNIAEVYGGDMRLGLDLKNEKYQHILKNKEFRKYYKDVLLRIKDKNSQYNQNNIKNLYNSIIKLDFFDINKKMKLIDEDTLSIYIPHIFEHDNKIYDGKKILDDYKNILEIADFAEREIRLMRISPDLSLFTYQVYLDNIKNVEVIGGIYYIENNKYIKDGKFDSESFYKDHK